MNLIKAFTALGTCLAALLSGTFGLFAQSVVSAAGDPVITHKFIVKTSMGEILLGLYGKDAPKTTENFKMLATAGYYDSILVHRVAPDFVIQAGDPQTRDTALRSRWGRGGKSAWGGKFEDELNPETPSYRSGYQEGTLAMANSGPNTNGSQFFICLEDTDLPKKYTIFGRVLSGMKNVHTIGETELLPNTSIPANPVIIYSIRETVEPSADSGK
ncbi:hypothetical protein MASR2M18_07290 [Ignavibacteria bacterium]|nr:peptidylprolyl isomerase [Bacteroidota bacterium]MCZ2132700.1 peptidylprolyl isomerase [Bacteroidota bacterium]